ncbi:MAG TPA: DedA family protein [Spirochaetota bacterium]|nr:DedA family protein [Spirochaetota bacterium]HSA13317.1 DedA family protein [Spirochaetota bacterium]
MVEIQSLVDFFQNHGYLAVFSVLLACGFGVPIPEDISLVSGGIIAGLGYADPFMMVMISMAGVLIGDAVIFMIGRKFGERFFEKHRLAGKKFSHNRIIGIQEWFARYGKWVIFAARFMPGFRAPIFATAGITRFVSFWTFFAIDFLAALISVPAWVYLGYYGATQREWLLKWISRGQKGALTLAAIVAVLVLFSIIFKKKVSKNLNGHS